MPILYEYNTLKENISLAKKLNLDFIELNLNFGYLRDELENNKDLFKELQANNLEVTCHFYDEADFGSYQEITDNTKYEYIKIIYTYQELLEKEKELERLTLELTKEKEKLKIQEEQLKDKENELNNNQLEINKKQEELELFHNNLLTREKELNTLSLELTRKEQNVDQNNYKYCETLLNGTIENPKTFDDLFKYVILSILSLITIVSIYLFKRRKHANL